MPKCINIRQKLIARHSVINLETYVNQFIISYITTIDSSRHKVPTTWYGSDQTHMPYGFFFWIKIRDLIKQKSLEKLQHGCLGAGS